VIKCLPDWLGIKWLNTVCIDFTRLLINVSLFFILDIKNGKIQANLPSCKTPLVSSGTDSQKKRTRKVVLSSSSSDDSIPTARRQDVDELSEETSQDQRNEKHRESSPFESDSSGKNVQDDDKEHQNSNTSSHLNHTLQCQLILFHGN